MCDLFECNNCIHKCKYNATDNEIETLWEDLKDVLFDEDENGMMILSNDWEGFSKGTDVDTIWHWFDEHHSKCVGWLMNEYEHKREINNVI